jgi:CheY-like chemotaxis protein/signal transduction histidine kinase/CHASE3 domain sensor protein
MQAKSIFSKSSRSGDNLRVSLGLGAVVIFFIATGLVSYWNTRTLNQNVAQVVHTHNSIMILNDLLSLVKDAETGQRGYVITGEEKYLEPYNAAVAQVEERLSGAAELVRDAQNVARRIPLIRDHIQKKLNELKETIELRRTKGFQAAYNVVITDRGKADMDALRAQINEAQAEEVAYRVQRIAEMDKAYYVAVISGIFAGLLGAILSIAVAYLIHNANRARSRQEWSQAGIVGLNNAMAGEQRIDQLGEHALTFLTDYFGAHSGAFYYLDKHEYKLAATYGVPATSNIPRHFELNDGLLGQTAQSNKIITLNDVPEGYLELGSALGHSKPRHLVIAPATSDGTVNAVIEIGFINPIDDLMVELLKSVNEQIAVAVRSANYRLHLQNLLEETQRQTEELQAQSEEMRVANEELQRSEEELKTQQEELQASNEELEEKTAALETQNSQIRQQSQELDENRKAIEAKASELELASKYKSEFLANMSHELRTPLNSLLILARSLASNEDKNLTEEQVEEARIIHSGGLELLNLINDILDLSKVEAGKLNFVAEDSSLESTIKKLQQQFDPIAKERGIAFCAETAGNVPAILHTDAQRLEQILKNLLSNAFKFTEKGTVTLKIHTPEGVELQRASLDGANAIAFSVEDTGIGIDATKLRDIFEAFQQEDGSTDRHYGGTGLGLTIARKFAHMMGGEIHVRSEKGQGSTFTLVLPVAMPSAAARAHEAPKVHAFAPRPMNKAPVAAVAEFIADDRKIASSKDKVLLIIEDDKNFAATLMKMARQQGYKCLAAGDGKTGLLMAMEQPVTAIILDLTLPDMDGLQVLDQLKHDLRSRPIPVHVISGREEGSDAASLRKGAIGYLTKPVEKEALDSVFSRIDTLLKAEMKHVLVVEDDLNNQAAIKKLLKQKDITLSVVETGSAAMQEIKKTHFDCVILDLRLPDMTGFEWLEQAEKEFGSNGLPPIIVYTAKELSEEENRRLSLYTGNIIIKGAKSPERLLDEVTLFLHSVESSLSKDQQEMIRMQHDTTKVLQGRTVLLVDDDLRNTFALSKILRKQGMTVVIADNGQMALDKLKEERAIEAVIMDIMMPIMDGYQAIREIRAQKAYQQLPVIALTTRAMPEEQEKCIAAGANDYLVKPVDLERLLTLLRVWLFKQEMAA